VIPVDDLLRVVEKVESIIAEGPIGGNVTPSEIRNHLAARYNFAVPTPLNNIVTDVEQMLQRWQVQVTHPRYFGLFNPSVTPASVVAEAMVAMYNPQLAAWRTSPAANEIERHTLQWLIGKFGLPSEAVGNFTSGGAEANLSAVIVALTRAFPGYGDEGVRSVPASPTVYVTSESHHSFRKIAHTTGLGRCAIRIVGVDEHLKMDLGHLQETVASDRRLGFAPLMVVGTAGTTSAGIIDPLPEIARFCRSEGLWFHADAAWGGAAVISPQLRKFLDGIDQADSITCDAHKWFSVPMGAGMFFCRHPEAVRKSFSVETSYMPSKTAGIPLDPYTSTIQWSRRFIGLKFFVSLAHFGEPGYISMIERQTAMGELLRDSLKRTGWRIVNSTPLPVVCFTRDGLNTTDFLARLYQRQIAWMSEVRLAGGPPLLRACITSFRTSEADIERVTSEINNILSLMGKPDPMKPS